VILPVTPSFWQTATFGQMGAFWQIVGLATHFAGACAAATTGAWLFGRRNRFGPAGNAIVASLALTGLWSLAVAVDGSQSLVASFTLAGRNLAYLCVIYRLFASDGRHTSVAPVRPVIFALTLVDLLLPVALVLERRMLPASSATFLHVNVMLTMLLTVGSLVLLHNLYVGAGQGFRAVLRWPASALALVWGYELNLYTVAYLGRDWPVELDALHGLVDAGFAVILGIGVSRGRAQLRLRPSRTVTFQSISLLLIGAYFLAMVGITEWLAYAGGDFARWLQYGFLIAASTAALLTLPSRRLRGWLRVTLTKHLFQHRYDYRAEWLRFTRTIGAGGEGGGDMGGVEIDHAAPLYQRVIQAVADITDSPAGLLLTPDDYGDLLLSVRWQWPTAEVPAPALGRAGVAFLEAQNFIVDLDKLRAGRAAPREAAIVPIWLLEETSAWAVVPLLHFDRLIGAIVLARPPHHRKLDWEDFDLLRVVGQQLASYMAEYAGQQALTEASRFDDFHRRIAFVMHDIKNLASQFSLLARNAERHAENPEFRSDMLITLRNSADKLNMLIARLSRYGSNAINNVEPVEVTAQARAIATRFAGEHAVSVIERQSCIVSGNRDSFEQVLLHVVQNAIDASEATAPVFISIGSDGLFCCIEVVDAGQGMSVEFVRQRLFRPFDSSKPGGFGIGAYEARELVRAMGGRLDVESREGEGSRFTIRLPLASASHIRSNLENPEQKVA
jgi:putative PEP-CTERM system histidine kinase